MAYLQDAHIAARLAEIDRHGVELLPVWRSRLLRKLAGASVSGHLGDIGGHAAAVYLAGGRLWLAIDAQAWHLDETNAEIDHADDRLAIVIRTPRQRYDMVVESHGLEYDTTPFADLEDSCFGLWAARIIRDRERQQVLRTALEDTSLEKMPEHARDAAKPSAMHMPQWRLPSSGVPRDGEHRAE